MCGKESFVERLQWEKGEIYYISMVVNSAPLIKGIKASHIINLNKEEVTYIREIYGAYGIDSKILCEKKENVIMLFYRKDRLEKHLFQKECLSFLETFGYAANNFEVLLDQLCKRMENCVKKRKEFPHEIGTFLEYPIDDIKGFITHKGQCFLFSGYWKVYTNPFRARQIFREYDTAKKDVVNQLEFQKICVAKLVFV